MTAAEKRVWTPAEYLAWERAQPEKHAYYRGEIFGMAGASEAHNLIVTNVVALLWNGLRGRPCRTYPSDMRVKIPATGLYTYPDASVVCGPSDFEDGEHDTLLNPKLLVEVLSPSTEAYDRGKKLAHYRTIDSLREVLLIAQDEALVDHYVRQSDGAWLLRSMPAGKAVELSSIGCSLAVDDLYLNVTFEAGRALP
jgi:Uma2 family endonuclease